MLLHEKVKYFRDIRNIRNIGGYDEKELSFASGNMFESLALSNPELFNMYKLKQLQYSKDLFKDFDEYYGAIIDQDYDRYLKYLNDFESGKSPEFDLFTNFNVAYYSVMQKDMEYLSKELSEKEVMRIIAKNYLPEGLSEDGIKRLIRVRIANNNILVSHLISMLKQNCILLDISSSEASALINKLKDDRTSHIAIGQIKDKFADLDTIKKFKVGNNYDFRSIGGAYLCLGKDMEFEGDAIKKNLLNIFKYDCIIYTHGIYVEEDRKVRVSDLINNDSNYADIVDGIRHAIDIVLNDDKIKEAYPNKIKKDMSEYLSYCNNLLSNKPISRSDMEEFNNRTEKLYKSLIDLYNSNDDDLMPWWYKEDLVVNIMLIDTRMQQLYIKYHPLQALYDSKSSDWLVSRPINTLTKTGLTHVIDIIRALKKEGFKNILVNVCNPGHVELPIDIRSSPTFNVSMGRNTAIIESACINESNILQSISLYIKSLKSKVLDFCKSIKIRMNRIIDNRVAKMQFSKQIKIYSFNINKNRGLFEQKDFTDTNSMKKYLESCNNSIIDRINAAIQDEDKYMEMLNKNKSIFDDINLI